MKEKLRSLLVRMGYCSKPDFIIIGAQKAGTSALFDMLNQHQHIMGSNKKEIHYFSNDEWSTKKKYHSYHSYFPLPHQHTAETKLFEATPIYLFHPGVAARLHEYNDKLKLIVLLRNPVSRAYSAWNMYHQNFKDGPLQQLHDPRSFSEAVTHELANIDSSDYYVDRRSYVKRAIYADQIENYLKYFPKNQLLFIESNQLHQNHESALKKIQAFIGVPCEALPLKESHQAKRAKSEEYQSEEAKLRSFYKPHNERLYAIVGEDYGWDD